MQGKKTGRVESVPFQASTRHHTPGWILKKIADLVNKSKRLEDSSSMLYACLEARNLLEMISTVKLQCSVSEDDRDRVTAAVKPQHGIQGVNKELKSLGLKTQEFMNITSALSGYEFPVFNFSQADDLQHRLSQYIHTYAVAYDDMHFGSGFINQGFTVIEEAVDFAKFNLVYNPERNTVAIGNIDVTTLPEWAKELLNEWKSGRIKDKKLLEAAIEEAGQKYSDSKNAPQTKEVN